MMHKAIQIQQLKKVHKVAVHASDDVATTIWHQVDESAEAQEAALERWLLQLEYEIEQEELDKHADTTTDLHMGRNHHDST